MAAGIGKHKLMNLGPTEPWSIKEKLCLASSVMRSGDQNWVSVSRAIKPFAEAGRPPDWFSQKHCASQYSELLETTETPKRKRGEKGEVVETVEDVIVRKLTAERIEELKKIIKETQEVHRKLKKEAELVQAGHLDSKLEDLWNDILMKKKQEEEEAELKRKATDAAYQARQAAKNTPKRLPSVHVRSPLGASSPSMDYPMVSTPQPGGDEFVSGGLVSPSVNPVFMPAPETPGPPCANTSSLENSNLSGLIDDSPQKKLLGQKATPPPSPLLSELLKKGSLLPSSPRLVSEADVHMGNPGVHMEFGGMVTGIHSTDMPPAAPAIPASPAATGAPTLSRLLEAGPVQFTPSLASFSSVSSEPASAKPAPSLLPLPSPSEPACQPAVLSATILEPPVTVCEMDMKSPAETSAECPPSGDASGLMSGMLASDCVPRSAEGSVAGDSKGDLGMDDDLVSVPYMGDELDLDTVGDIIAIIEEKVDDNSEALDAAAVEAALSLCEDATDAHALTDPWEQSFKTEHNVVTGAVELTHKTEEGPQLLEDIAVLSQSIAQSGMAPEVQTQRDVLEVKQELTEQEVDRSSGIDPNPLAGNLALETPSSAVPAVLDYSETRSVEDVVPQCEVLPHAHSSPTDVAVKCESDDLSQQDSEQQLDCHEGGQEGAGTSCKSLSKELGDTSCSSLQLQDMKDEDGCSEVASMDEPKEEEANEAYLSETENEPPVSESDDGYSIHNAQLQMSALAESIPSSPASSQFSMCSEDQEAIQAQKIWKKAIMLVWRAAANHRYANVFLQPVTDDIAPGYHSIVHRPMDLSTIKKNIENGLIRTTAEFQRDIMLMFQNAVMYNSSDHDVYHMAVEMQRDVLEQIQQFLATQLIMQTSESGISAKSLRGRDSARKQDASDKDSVPMGSPAFLLSLFDGGTRGRRCAIEADMKMKK
ncbi:bromodomain-containing protein 8 isoform X1 [Polypterus senegalus]|nr:bromodomain-containing protein 8 isoform X1 [Polypterus senegalus]